MVLTASTVTGMSMCLRWSGNDGSSPSVRIPDVGNPWLDAGIVGYSTLQYNSDPDYWRQWRAGHPEYVERNRAAQRERNARRRVALAAEGSQIAKGDAWPGEALLPSGTYRLERWTGGRDCKGGRVNGQNLFVISAVASG